jgi:hypothetical protein
VKVEGSTVEVVTGSILPMLKTSEIQPTRPHEPHFIECRDCHESLTIDESILFRCKPGSTLVFPCPKCKTMKVIGVESRLVIGNAITGPDAFGPAGSSKA